MRALTIWSLLLLLLAGVTIADADEAVVCAKLDARTGTSREGSTLRVRSACRTNEIEVEIGAGDDVKPPQQVVDASGRAVGEISRPIDLQAFVRVRREVDGQLVELSVSRFAIYGASQGMPLDQITIFYPTTDCSGRGFISWSGGFYPSGHTMGETLYYATDEPREMHARAWEKIFRTGGPSGCVTLYPGAESAVLRTLAPYATADLGGFEPPFSIE